MEMKHFQFESGLARRFIEFPYRLYRSDPCWIPPLRRNVFRQFSPDFPFYRERGNRHRHFLVMSKGDVLGRVSAMVNRKLADRDGTPVGSIGFFECVNEYSVAERLLAAATKWIRDECGIERIWGPMNFDIWNDYRFKTRGFDQTPFLGEPYNMAYYPAFFERFGFAPKAHWDSFEVSDRQTLETMIARGAQRYRRMIGLGYRIEPFDVRHRREDLEKLHRVLSSSFRDFLGFTEVPFSEFEERSLRSLPAVYPPFFVLVYNENNVLVGFACALLELSDAVRAMNGRSHLISRMRFLRKRAHVDRINFYLEGITPEEEQRKNGLGRALFYYVINQTLREGYEKMLFTLMSRTTYARALLGPNAPTPQREYTLYELNS